jgi:hypothetical protein
MKEILTIQCGSAANYVGTHFWNLLDAQCPPPLPPAPGSIRYAPLSDTPSKTPLTMPASCSGHPLALMAPLRTGTPALSASTPKRVLVQ